MSDTVHSLLTLLACYLVCIDRRNGRFQYVVVVIAVFAAILVVVVVGSSPCCCRRVMLSIVAGDEL